MSLGVTPTELPRQFGKYFILGHLATGGMAEVYLARSAGIEGFEKIVVIKRVRPDLTGDTNTTGQFLDEARLVATLDHPNIAQVYEIGFVQGGYFFVMEYVQGADLRQLIKASIRKKQAIGLAHALYIMIDVCAALHYAHAKTDNDGKRLGIIHRDVSPSNVLISHDGAVKVCDFGIAKASTRNTETARGTLKGKFSYMSPEQCRCEPLDARSDVFAIGILLYELTTLKKLFDGPNDFELMKAVLEHPIKPPSAVSKSYPPDLERIVMRALERDPNKRYETAQEMQADLEDFAREHKLALSSIGITELMGSLFEKQADAHMRAKRASKSVFDPAAQSSLRDSQPIPVLSRVETRDGDVFLLDMDDTNATPKRMPVGTVDSAPTPTLNPRPGRRRRAIWIVGALVAAMAAGGATLAGRMLTGSNASGLRAELDQAAERLAFTIDSAARTARTRVDGLAATPMLRAAIDTDESTMRDVFASELGYTPEPDEVVEVFQNRGGETSLMIRIPATAAALVPLAGRAQRIQSDGANLALIVAAPLKGKEMTGLVQIASKIDLDPIRPRLAGGFASAKITGLDKDVVLVDGDVKGESLSVAVPVTGETELKLIATAKPAATTPTWMDPVRWASAALAALLLLIYAIGTRKVEGR